MASYFIFCRFWPRFTDPISFGQLNHLDAGAIEQDFRIREYKANRQSCRVDLCPVVVRWPSSSPAFTTAMLGPIRRRVGLR